MNNIIALIFISSAVAVQFSVAHPLEKDDDICLTRGCIQAAAEILERVDEKRDPCDDFYAFSCGRWIDKKAAPDSYTGTHSELSYLVQRRLRDILESEVPTNLPPEVIEIERKVRDFYHSCANLDGIEQRGDDPVLIMLDQLGGWPVLDGQDSSAQDDEFDWIALLGRMRQYGFNHNILFKMEPQQDPVNMSINMLTIDQVEQRLIDDFTAPLNPLVEIDISEGPRNSKANQKQLELMVDVAIALGAESELAQRDMAKVIDFRAKLVGVCEESKELNEHLLIKNKLRLKHLNTMAPNIDWKRLIRVISGANMADEDFVYLNEPHYPVELEKLIMKTDPRTLRNYIIWNVIYQSLDSLRGDKWKQIRVKYSNPVSVAHRDKQRSASCVRYVMQSFEFPLASMYVRRHFPVEIVDNSRKMGENIVKAFTQMVDQSDWLDEATKLKAKEKIEALLIYVGYPSELDNTTFLRDLYSSLEVKRDEYYENSRGLSKFLIDRQMDNLYKENKRTDWESKIGTLEANAYYYLDKNFIFMCAGIFGGAFYRLDRPNYMNYAGLGSVFGHELTHGFDNKGRHHDKTGNYSDWWSEDTDLEFTKRAKCIVQQYQNYTMKQSPYNGTNIRGLATVSENIADNGGLNAALIAYDEWKRSSNKGQEELKLPGLPWNQDQLFWMTYANINCQRMGPGAKLIYDMDVHSQNEARVNVVVANFDQFSKAFDCKLGSKLNPINKCKLW